MTVEKTYYADLALRFLQHSLDSQEKQTVQRLIMESAQFKEVLKEEIALKRKLQTLKKTLPSEVKARIHIRTKNKLAYAQLLKPVLEATLPEILRPFLQLLQRRVFVHE